MSLSLNEFVILTIYVCHLIGLLLLVQYLEQQRIVNRRIAIEEEAEKHTYTQAQAQDDSDSNTEEEEVESKPEEFTMIENPMFIHREESIRKED